MQAGTGGNRSSHQVSCGLALCLSMSDMCNMLVGKAGVPRDGVEWKLHFTPERVSPGTACRRAVHEKMPALVPDLVVFCIEVGMPVNWRPLSFTDLLYISQTNVRVYKYIHVYTYLFRQRYTTICLYLYIYTFLYQSVS